MEAMKNGMSDGKKLRMVGDLLWFASASMAAGLLAAVAVAALAMLLAQPARAAEAAGFTEGNLGCPRIDYWRAERSEELDGLNVEECETGVDLTENGFLRLIDRERRELGDLLRHVEGAREVLRSARRNLPHAGGGGS